MSLMRDLESGVAALPLGFRLLGTRGVPALLAIPFGVTLIVYGAVLALTLPPLLDLLSGLTTGWPQWVLDWFGWLIVVLKWLLGTLLVLLVGWLGVMLAGILAGPFYGQISAKVEARLTGQRANLERGLGAEFAAAVGRELQKLLWSVPRLLALLLLGLIPGLNILSAPLSLLIGAWIMAVQFADFSPENRGLSFREARYVLGDRQALVLGFGLPTAFGIGIPFLNLLVAPAAVAGGTAVWLRCSGEWDGRRGLE